jgi:ribonucleoside-diphosphate reductase alpha chain
MATSVIDYIFRDLAISYLKRTDLAQVKPEDLLATGTRSDTENNGTVKASAGFRPHGAAAEAAPDQARTDQGRGDQISVAEQEQAAKIAQARVKGYEGDPCPVCGYFTLIRNGTCLKCDTCGGTTGCS